MDSSPVMRTLHDEIRSWWGDSQPDATKDQVIPAMLALLERIEALEQQVQDPSSAALAHAVEHDSVRN